MKYWRSDGIIIILYLDDGIAASASDQGARQLALKLRQDLLDFGFLLADEKCQWVPSQIIEWLGFVFDTSSCTIAVTQKRLYTFLLQCKSVLNNANAGKLIIPARHLASLAGQIQSMKGSIGNLVPLLTKFCHAYIDTRLSWNYSFGF